MCSTALSWGLSESTPETIVEAKALSIFMHLWFAFHPRPVLSTVHLRSHTMITFDESVSTQYFRLSLYFHIHILRFIGFLTVLLQFSLLFLNEHFITTKTEEKPEVRLNCEITEQWPKLDCEKKTRNGTEFKRISKLSYIKIRNAFVCF